MYHYFFNQRVTDGHLACSQDSGFYKQCSVNNIVCTSFRIKTNLSIEKFLEVEFLSERACDLVINIVLYYTPTGKTWAPISSQPHPHSTLTLSIFTYPIGFKMTSQCNFKLTCISLNMRETEHLCTHSGVICVSCSDICLFIAFSIHLSTGKWFFFFSYWF